MNSAETLQLVLFAGKAKKGHLCFDAIYETGSINTNLFMKQVLYILTYL